MNMTRYTRAKGAKASNERLPKDATPWHIMKQQLQKNQEKPEAITKNKSAKELLKEKEHSVRNGTVGINSDWAKFEEPIPVQKQQNNDRKLKATKLSKRIKQNEHSENGIQKQLKNNVCKTTSNVSSKPLKRKLSESNGNQITNENKKSIKQKSCSADQNTGSKSDKNILRITNKEKKKNIRSNNNDSIDTNTNTQTDNLGTRDGENSQIKKKKKLEHKQPDVKNENSKSEGILSKRQKRNIKKKEINADKPGRFVRLNNQSNNVINQTNKFGKGNLNQRNKSNHAKSRKIRDDKEHNRRKPDFPMKVMINGIEIELVRYDGFPVKKEDAERLKDLKEKMIMKGIPKSEIDAAMKLERRRAEKALARDKKNVCFHCRVTGHNLSECPNLNSTEIGTGICFKCGSTEHTHFECKVTKRDEYRYATCFICREQGHISKQCPDNPKGVYPQGGACRLCGDVTHLKKDCPDLIQQNEETAITLGTINGGALESLDGEVAMNAKTTQKKKPQEKIVTF